jgi:RNA polymerase II-associated factor 1
LENCQKYDFHPELDLGITIDLINSEAYEKEKNATLDPADEKLLEEDVGPKDAKR